MNDNVVLQEACVKEQQFTKQASKHVSAMVAKDFCQRYLKYHEK